MKNLHLNALKSLQTQLGKEAVTPKNEDELFDMLDALRAEKEQIRIKKVEDEQKQRLDAVNKKQKEDREFLKLAHSLELPSENILTDSGKFHAVEVKKYPSLVKFLEKYPYARFEFVAPGVWGVNRFSLKRTKYNYQKEDEYFDFENFEELLRHNGVQVKPLSWKSFKSQESKLLKESEKIKKLVSDFEEKKKDLNFYFLEKEKLVQSSQNSFYSVR